MIKKSSTIKTLQYSHNPCFHNSNVQSTEFDDAILKFLQLYKASSLPELFNENNIDILTNELLHNDIIFAYLTRSHHLVKFKNDTPILDSKYEYDLYTALSEKIPITDAGTSITHHIADIPYRITRNNEDTPNSSDSQLNLFYNSGTIYTHLQYILYTISEKNKEIFFVKEKKNNADIYRIGSFLYHLKYFDSQQPFANYGDRQLIIKERQALIEQDLEHNVKFVTSFNLKDRHATVIFVVLDEYNKPLLSTFINSSLESFNIMEHRFHNKVKGDPFIDLENNLLEELLIKCNNFITKEDRVNDILGIMIPDKYYKYHTHEEYRDILNAIISDKSEECCEGYPNNIPFIDASHSLQTAKDDLNCALYALSNVNAISNMLQDKELQAELIYLTKSEQFESFKELFQYHLQHNLPQYFNCTEIGCTPKSEDELKTYHLNLRWDIGSEFLKANLYECHNTAHDNYIDILDL